MKAKKPQEKQHKTKEELFEIRKQMMKKRNRSTSPNKILKQNNPDNSAIDVNIDDLKDPNGKNKQKQKGKEPSNDLLERLAGGKKQKVYFYSLDFIDHSKTNETTCI